MPRTRALEKRPVSFAIEIVFGPVTLAITHVAQAGIASVELEDIRD
jgi:hypothetical protein